MPVFINNVDDYLGPSQACVNPLFAPPPKPTPSPDANLVNSAPPKVAKIENSDTSQKVVQSKRRTRQRRAPRIIQSEESNLSAPNTEEPIRLTNDKDKNVDESLATPTIIADTNTQIIKKKATVTLSDCLSCSGCVTSAEAVLLSHHSIDMLREVSLSQNQQKKKIVFTISSASAADLYRHLYLEVEDCDISSDGSDRNPSRHEFLATITDFLRSEFGAEMVIDGAVSQRISLMESASEFCYRYRKSQSSKGDEKKEESIADMPSVALSSTKTRYINKQPNSEDEDTLMEVTTLSHPPGCRIEEDKEDGASSGAAPKMTAPIQSTSLPVLTSSCPGFVCLVEKTAPSVVPLLSSAKSPMVVAGTLLKVGNFNKNDASESDKLLDESCYHVAIMPCHDKKLEAGRSDLAWERQALLRYGNALKSSNQGNINAPKTIASVEGSIEEVEDLVNEVDLVLTTGELLEVLGEAAAKMKRGEASTLTTQLPSTSEKDDSSAIRHFLSKNDLTHSSCALMTAKNDNRLNGNEGTEDDNNLELDTGVHGSGSYADFIFRYVALELFGCKLPQDKPLPWKGSSSTYSGTGKAAGVIRRRRRRQETTDLREITLYEHSDGTYSYHDKTNDDIGHRSKPVLRFATAYGFKNVQLILQSLSKTDPSSHSNGYDYVEIMACPSGCSNGGGQIGSNGRRETPRETKERVKKTVSAVPILRPSVECGSLATALCGCDAQSLVDDSILHSECFGESARQLLHTRFHVVPKLELSTGATAGVALSDTKW